MTNEPPDRPPVPPPDPRGPAPDEPREEDERATERTGGFFRMTVARPVALMTLFATLIVVGLIAYRRIPLQLLPSGFADPSIHMWIPNPGASAQENEETIARIIEDQLRTLAGIEQIRSWSDDSDVELRVEFDPSLDMDLAKAEVRDRIERARPLLPKTVDTIGMWSEDADTLPLTFFGILLKGDPDRRDFLMDSVVIPRLEAIKGIGKVDVWGKLEDTVRILLDEDKVVAAQLDLGDIIRRLNGDNFALPMGEVDDGGREIILRSDMRFKSPEEIAEFPIGNGLKLRDVGRVARVKSVGEMLSRIDGSYAYYGMATKDSQANVVETSHNFKRTIEELAEDPALRGQITVLDFFVQGDLIESALTQLRQTAIGGGVLAVIVLFVFLRRVRLTLCVALSIPVSALMAITFEYFTGGSFNLLTMTGITLGIGMLVDNAIVVVENIARIRARGEDAKYAAEVGTRQIALAVTLATLTTVVVFLPLIFMSENAMVRVMFGSIGIPLSVSLLASLLVAVVFLPVISARILGARPAAAERVASGLVPLGRLPARSLARGIGVLRWGWHRGIVALHRVECVVLRAVASPLRWLLALGMIGLAGWRAMDLSAPVLGGDALRAFGLESQDPVPMLRVQIGILTLLFLAVVLVLLPRARRRPRAAPVRPAAFVPGGDSLIDLVTRLNSRLVTAAVNHRLVAFCTATFVLLLTAVPMSGIDATPFGRDSTDDSVGFRVDFDTDMTLAEASDEIATYEDFLGQHEEEYGYEHCSVRFDERRGYINLYFEEPQPLVVTRTLSRRLERELPRIPGHRLRFFDENESQGATNSVVAFTLHGPDSIELERLGVEATKILETVPGLSGVSSPLTDAPDQIAVVIDRDKAHEYGVTTEAVQNTISYTLRGFPLPRFQEEGRDIPFLIEFDEAETAGLPTLRDLSVFGGQSMVPLATFAQLAFGKSRRTISRVDGQTSFTIEAKVDDPLQVVPITERAYMALSTMDLPRGYAWSREDSALQRQQEEFDELFKAMLLSIVLVFLLMGILFESVTLPFSVLFTLPFAFAGSAWTLFVTGTPFDSMGYIGGIILAGVVVNNGIVLIDRIHSLRASVPDRKTAVVLGCSQRVRPVLMTALTTVMGLLPMILSAPPPNGVDYRTLATILAGGLLISTLFTLWVVPLAYTIIDDLTEAMKRRFRWWGRLPEGARRRTATA